MQIPPLRYGMTNKGRGEKQVLRCAQDDNKRSKSKAEADSSAALRNDKQKSRSRFLRSATE
jgi:hypothetical protein